MRLPLAWIRHLSTFATNKHCHLSSRFSGSPLRPLRQVTCGVMTLYPPLRQPVSPQNEALPLHNQAQYQVQEAELTITIWVVTIL